MEEPRLAAQQHVDPVTGLLHYRAEEAAVLGLRTAAVLVVEVDGYLLTSQVVGPGAGDLLVVEAAARVRAAASALGGRVRRLGGPHFLVLLPVLDECLIHDVASHLALVHDRPAAYDAGALTVGVALGPRDGADLPTLIRSGMIAVAHAKREHPGTAVFYDPDMAEEARDRFGLGRALRTAIDRGDITLVYQPQVELTSGAVVGVEVLARWVDDVRGPISPARFVRIADQLGMARALDRLIFGKAIRQLGEWDRAGVPVPSLSINVSPDTLRATHAPDAVAASLANHGIAADRLTVELIESRMLEVDRGLATLRRVRELGMRVSLDDFGTGYASFSQLVTLPIDELKIDRGFLAGTEEATAGATIIDAIVRVGQTLGLDVVAEGIEREEQHELLRAMGCPVGQGYLYSHPLTATELVEWLGRRSAAPHVATVAPVVPAGPA
jgi:c-di-GMP-specific phosphodiesterase